MKFLELEEDFKNYVGTNYCITCNTGTSSLHLALEALKLPPDSEIIVPEFTMIATAWAVHYARLSPVFVDCTDDLLINVDLIEEKISSNTKAIMVTHVYGRIVNMDHVIDLAKKYNLRVIEDCAEAHGGYFKNTHVGSYDIGCFSFYRNKIVCGEEGGAITTNDKRINLIARDMKSMSFGEEHNFQHDQLGFNYRMTNSQACLIIKSLNQVKDNLQKRQKISELYDSLLSREILMPKRNVVWVYDIKVNASIKNKLVSFLNENNIQARHSFKPMSAQYPFNTKYKHLNAYKLSTQVCYLPADPSLTETNIDNICKLVNSFI
ncbi:aminotransferase [archaeon]|nr:aminotransferase [archaeon]